MKQFIFILLIFLSCASPQYKSDYQQTGQEISDIITHDTNLTPTQKIVLKHAEIELKTAQAQEKQNGILENKLISESKRAGAGTLTYCIIGIMALGIAAFVVSKFVKVV